MERKEKQELLYKRWEETRGYNSFVFDGVLNYEVWENTKPKIMFFLKESADNFTRIADNAIDITKGNGNHFWWNICNWKHLINSLYKNQNSEFPGKERLDEIKFKNSIIDDIAYVNAKKQCENKTVSNDGDIMEYVKNDEDLLVEQIDLITPDVVFCNKLTFKAYQYIYNRNLVEINENCCRDNNRLIISYYHPSYFQIKGGRKTLYYKLKNILTGDSFVLDGFNW